MGGACEMQKETQRDASKRASAPNAKRDVVMLAVLALVVRLAWLRWGAWMQNDVWEYLRLARNLVFHGVFSLSDGSVVGAAGDFAPTAFRPPLFPALIAALWWGEGEPVRAVLVANVVLGVLTVALVYFIARDKFNRATALIAGAALTLAPMTCWFTVTVLTETLFTFLATCGIFCWGRWRYALAGAAFGLAALTRPAILPFLVGVALLPLLPLVSTWRVKWRGHALLLLVALAVSSVWIVRNALVFDKLIPIAGSGWGTNLLCGTLETDTGGRVWTGTEWAALNLKTHPVTRVDENLSETEGDRVRMRRALERIAADPVQWFVVRARQYPKLFIDNGDYLLGASNLPLTEAVRTRRFSVVIVKTVFIGSNLLVMALAALGVWFERARFVELSHIVLFPLYGCLVHLPMWIEPRYFLPMMPAVFILAARAAVVIKGWGQHASRNARQTAGT